jgi:hypothetical protein
MAMEDDGEFTPEERKSLRRMLSEDQVRRDREAQAKAAKLARELRAKYGPLNRSGG